MALAEAAEQNRALLEEALVRLGGATRLLVLLLQLEQNLGPEQTAILEAALLPTLQDTPQLGWEESCDAAVSFLLRSCLSRSPREEAWSLAQQGGVALTPPRDTARLKRNVALLCDRIAKGGRLSLAPETTAAPQGQAAPGGVEPIAEATGHEMELHQEATAFIKRKQPSRKGKKAVGGCSGADAERPPGPGLPAGDAFRPGGEEAPGAVEAEADRVGEEPPQRLQPAESRAGPCRPLPRHLPQPGARGTHRPPAKNEPPRELHTEQSRQEDFVF
ncbi:protein PTHB1-like isoform X2 [Pseudoliparis swirei]|uniref:protein PTHB1-like isoform X2 n=1 Tax=Pseudoliparis swirei TaxID=2059687 RepID=UPI0024BEF8D6|nr:protein PTHB1-like isoform X2 [Pseudoliparis swirei]